MRTAAVSQ